MIITIDGPMASGKSTVARLVAQRLEIYYIASGFIYRAFAYELSKKYAYTRATINAPSVPDLASVAHSVSYTYTAGKESVCLDGIDITNQLKSSAIDALASIMSTNNAVREHINMYLRQLATRQSIVIDGRDCGSVIFPNADYKFYVTASVTVRAARWQAMQAYLGFSYTLEQCGALVTERDERDTTRAQAPLIVPHGAQVIDCSRLRAQQVTDTIIQKIKEAAY